MNRQLSLFVVGLGAVVAPPALSHSQEAHTPAGTPSPGTEIPSGPQANWQAATPGGSLPGDPRIDLEMVAEGLVDPVNVVSAGDGSNRLFVVERHGVVRIVRDGSVVEEPFLDITDQTLAAFLEQGLYDVEFHPNFSENGHVYVHFAEMLRNGDSVIVRYTVSAENPDKVDPDSAKLIMQIDQPWANHNGGEIEFGPDNYLWIGSGDGGWEGDPLEAGENINTLLGKVLRIDVDVPEDQFRPYDIPPDNPFTETEGIVQLFGLTETFFAQLHTLAKPEIWAYGLRNPWKFQFDPETGDLWLPDVGQNYWEEINFVPAGQGAGANFGWDHLMGTRCFPLPEGGEDLVAGTDCPAIGVPPVAEYSHDAGCAVIGLGVYRSQEIPALGGAYLAGDYCSGTIWAIARTEGEAWQMAEVYQGSAQITGAGQGDDGALYVTTCNCNYGGPAPTENPPGTLWRIVPAAQQ